MAAGVKPAQLYVPRCHLAAVLREALDAQHLIFGLNKPAVIMKLSVLTNWSKHHNNKLYFTLFSL